MVCETIILQFNWTNKIWVRVLSVEIANESRKWRTG